MRLRTTLLLGCIGISTTGCIGEEPLPKWPTSPPSELCGKPTQNEAEFCMPATQVEGWMKRREFEITDAAISDSGTTNPYKLRLKLPDGRTFSAKFKEAPDDFDAFNNSPRRELAAYEIQKLFLDADEYVVPPTVLTCIPVDRYRSLMPDLEAHDDVDCAVGVLSYWIDGITSDEILDEDRYKRDARYREALGNLSMLTVLIGHQDDIGANFYRLEDPKAPPHLFAIDNGLAFGAMGANPIQLFSSGWSHLRVDTLPKKGVERLQKLEPKDFDKLAVVTQFERRNGTYVFVPNTEPFDPKEGVRERGNVVQLGLTAGEITDANIRLVEMLREIREGKVHEMAAAGPSR